MSGRLEIEQAVHRTVSGMGYELVDVERCAGGLLRVTIDRVPGQAYANPGEFVMVEDCEAVTRQLQHVLEVEACDYARLEVSSPGLDRPLRKASDWHRFAGHEVDLTLRMPYQGRRHWRGRLSERAGGWRLELPAPVASKETKRGASSRRRPAAQTESATQTLDFDLDQVREARLVPAVDFKGRKASPAARPAEAA